MERFGFADDLPGNIIGFSCSPFLSASPRLRVILGFWSFSEREYGYLGRFASIVGRRKLGYNGIAWFLNRGRTGFDRAV
jgi:hypothetical protein